MNHFHFLKSPRQWLVAATWFGLVMGLGLVAQAHFKIIYNVSDSLPMRFFVQVRHGNPQKGDYTLISSPLYGRPLIKQIIGQAGDQLVYDNEGILYVGDQKVGTPHGSTSEGKSVDPIPAQQIPQGYVFVYAPHERSFDSRYQQLGLVPLRALQGRALPVI